KRFEYALEDNARNECLHGLDVGVMLFHVIGDPTARRDRMARGAADMKRDRQVVFGGGFVNRPIAAASEWLHRTRRHQYLHERLVCGTPFDFLDCFFRIIVSYDD